MQCFGIIFYWLTLRSIAKLNWAEILLLNKCRSTKLNIRREKSTANDADNRQRHAPVLLSFANYSKKNDMCARCRVPCDDILVSVCPISYIFCDDAEVDIISTVMPFFTFNAFQIATWDSRMRKSKRNCKRFKLIFQYYRQRSPEIIQPLDLGIFSAFVSANRESIVDWI